MKAVVLSRLPYFLLCLFYSLPVITAGQPVSGIINTYHKITAVNTGTNTLTLDNISGLSLGTSVLIIQMQGAAIDNSNSASFGNISAVNNAGNYEFNSICSISGNDVLLQFQLVNSYDVSGNIQLISFPRYNVVTIADTVKASPWNSATGKGGVIVLEADTILLNSAIDASGAGFSGGGLVNFPTPTYDCVWLTNVTNYFMGIPTPGTNYSAGPKGEGIAGLIAGAEYARGKQANGGGGGNNHNAGGGGGSNYGTGGSGGNRSNETTFQCHGTSPGIGGLSLTTLGYSPGNNRIFLGGGGGAGHQNNAVGTPGGNGGGIVIINANVIAGTGTSIMANGAVPVNPALAVDPYSSGGDGAGGGGAGGTVILNINQVVGNITATAAGGRGSDAGRTGATGDCPGPGGGGGGGVVWMKGGSPIANVTTNINGGANGVVSPLSVTVVCQGLASGATAGANGAALTGYSLVVSSPLTCVPLPVPELKSFTAQAGQNDILLKWTLRQVEGIAYYLLQRSVDQVNYTTVYRANNEGSRAYSYSDKDDLTGTIFYRLIVIRTNGKTDYSSVIRVTKTTSDAFRLIDLHPNPAVRELKLTFLSKRNTTAYIRFYNKTGQVIYKTSQKVSAGYSLLTLPVVQVPVGVYWLVAEADGVRVGKKFVKN